MAWQLLDGEPLRVRTRIAGEEDLTVVNLDYSTRRWELSDPDARTAVQVERTGNRLCAAGRLDGESIHLCRSIDAAPWYQTLSLSLRPFLDSSQTALEFWSLRPKTLKPYKLRAVKQQDEEIEVLGKKILAQRVEIRLAGLGGLFWKAHYWFRDSDALFVRYCGPTGLPGASKTIVTLQPPI